MFPSRLSELMDRHDIVVAVILSVDTGEKNVVGNRTALESDYVLRTLFDDLSPEQVQEYLEGQILPRSEREQPPKPVPGFGRIHEIVNITDVDLKRASEIPDGGCPRRYCWWWRSLAFEWEVTPTEGCTWLESEKPDHWKLVDVPCCRCDNSSHIDQFEARGLHMEVDGIDASGWEIFRRANREQYPG